MHGKPLFFLMIIFFPFPAPKTRLIFGFLGALGTLLLLLQLLLLLSTNSRRCCLSTPGLFVGVVASVDVDVEVVVVGGVDGVDATATAIAFSPQEHTIWLQQNCNGLRVTAETG